MCIWGSTHFPLGDDVDGALNVNELGVRRLY